MDFPVSVFVVNFLLASVFMFIVYVAWKCDDNQRNYSYAVTNDAVVLTNSNDFSLMYNRKLVNKLSNIRKFIWLYTR